MEIYLIRHTTPDIEKGICYGQTDLELAHTFSVEAWEVLKQLPNQFDAVYTSPLKRCKQLAQKIAPESIVDLRLAEINFGSWEMKPWDAIPTEEIEPWYKDWIHHKASKTGESYHELYERSVDFLSNLKEKSEELNRIAIVTHAGVIRALNAHINKWKLKDSFDLKLKYGEVILLKL